MKPEQASKVKVWMPTRLNNGKGRVGRGSNQQIHRFWSIGVVGTACRKGEPGNRGSPTSREGSGLIAVVGRLRGWVSDRVVVPLRPGNSGGGKGPDFWCAFEEGEGR